MDTNNSTHGKPVNEQYYELAKGDYHFLSDMLGYLRKHNVEEVEQMINDWMNELQEKIDSYEQDEDNEI